MGFEALELLIQVILQILHEDGFLLLGGEVLDLDGSVIEVVLPGDQSEFGPGAHRFLEEGAELPFHEGHLDGITGIAEGFGQGIAIVHDLLPNRHQIEIDAVFEVLEHPVVFHEGIEAFHAHREAHAGIVFLGPVEVAHHPVVVAPAEQGAVVFAFLAHRMDLEDDLAVIVQAADEGIVDFVIDLLIGEDRKRLIEAFAGLIGEVILHLRGEGSDFLVLFDLAIEDPHRVQQEPLLAILAHGVDFGGEEAPESLFVVLPARLVAEGVDLDFEVLESKVGEHLHGQADAFGVEAGAIDAHRFHASLDELAVPAKLRALITEDRADVKGLDGEIPGRVKLMLDDAADDSGSAFRTQSQRAVAFVQEGVHLLADDVAAFAGGAIENLGVFKNRRLDLAIAIKLGDGGENVLDIRVGIRLRAVEVMGSFDSLVNHSEKSSLKRVNYRTRAVRLQRKAVNA